MRLFEARIRGPKGRAYVVCAKIAGRQTSVISQLDETSMLVAVSLEFASRKWEKSIRKREEEGKGKESLSLFRPSKKVAGRASLSFEASNR